MISLSGIASERQAELEEAIEAAKNAGNQNTALTILLDAISSVRDSISDIAIEHVTVNNLDEVRAALRNELNRISKPVIAAIEKLRLEKQQVKVITEKIKADNSVALDATHDIQIVKRPKERITVDNLKDLIIPDNVAVRNFEELAAILQDSLKIDVPAPQVNVQTPEIAIPDINIPESSVNIDLESVIKALDPLKYISPQAKKPISVRLSDGQKFIKALKTLAETQERQATAFSQGLTESSARKAFKQAMTSVNDMNLGTAGGLALTDDTAGVALGSGACKVVDITAYGGLLAIGDSTSVRVDSSAAGVVLTPGSAYYRVFASNLNQIFVSGATGTRACYVSYS